MINGIEQAREQHAYAKQLMAEEQFGEAIRIFQDVVAYCKQEKEYHQYVVSMNALGIAYISTDDEASAVDCFLTALDCIERHGVKGCSHLLNNNIGVRYFELGDYEHALIYFLKAVDYISESEAPEEMKNHFKITCLLNIGDIYRRIKEFAKAEEYILEAKRLKEKFEIDSHEAFMQVLITELAYDKGDYAFVRKHIEEFVTYAEEQNDSIGDYAVNMKEIMVLLENMKDYENMKLLIDQFEEAIKPYDSLKLQLYLIEFYIKYYRCIGDEERYRDACVEHLKKYNEYKIQTDREKSAALTLKIDLMKARREVYNVGKKASTDAMTGLNNRHALEREIQPVMKHCQKDGLNLMVGILDIDCFKQYNDTYGHLLGDEILKKVADTIREVWKGAGVVYRYGGDEFLIVSVDQEWNDAVEKAELLKEKLKDLAIEHRASNISDKLTISQGYCIGQVLEENRFNDFVDGADVALYKVKKKGRNNFIFDEMER